MKSSEPETKGPYRSFVIEVKIIIKTLQTSKTSSPQEVSECLPPAITLTFRG